MIEMALSKSAAPKHRCRPPKCSGLIGIWVQTHTFVRQCGVAGTTLILSIGHRSSSQTPDGEQFSQVASPQQCLWVMPTIWGAKHELVVRAALAVVPIHKPVARSNKLRASGGTALRVSTTDPSQCAYPRCGDHQCPHTSAYGCSAVPCWASGIQEDGRARRPPGT